MKNLILLLSIFAITPFFALANESYDFNREDCKIAPNGSSYNCLTVKVNDAQSEVTQKLYFNNVLQKTVVTSWEDYGNRAGINMGLGDYSQDSARFVYREYDFKKNSIQIFVNNKLLGSLPINDSSTNSCGPNITWDQKHYFYCVPEAESSEIKKVYFDGQLLPYKTKDFFLESFNYANRSYFVYAATDGKGKQFIVINGKASDNKYDKIDYIYFGDFKKSLDYGFWAEKDGKRFFVYNDKEVLTDKFDAKEFFNQSDLDDRILWQFPVISTTNAINRADYNTPSINFDTKTVNFKVFNNNQIKYYSNKKVVKTVKDVKSLDKNKYYFNDKPLQGTYDYKTCVVKSDNKDYYCVGSKPGDETNEGYKYLLTKNKAITFDELAGKYPAGKGAYYCHSRSEIYNYNNELGIQFSCDIKGSRTPEAALIYGDEHVNFVYNGKTVEVDKSNSNASAKFYSNNNKIATFYYDTHMLYIDNVLKVENVIAVSYNSTKNAIYYLQSVNGTKVIKNMKF